MEPQPVSTTSLRITRVFKASRDQVWRALTDPKEIAKWYAPGPMTATIHKFDARPGGSFEVDLGESNGIPNRAYGKFVEVLPGRRLVQTWRWKDFPIDAGESRLTIELRDVPVVPRLRSPTKNWPVRNLSRRTPRAGQVVSKN